jgi:hypothetical protein
MRVRKKSVILIGYSVKVIKIECCIIERDGRLKIQYYNFVPHHSILRYVYRKREILEAHHFTKQECTTKYVHHDGENEPLIN